MLAPGEAFTLDRDGVAIVHATANATLRVATVRPRAAPRPGGAVLAWLAHLSRRFVPRRATVA